MNGSVPLRLFLIDHESGLAGLAGRIGDRLPGVRLVGSVSRAVDGVREIARLNPDVAVIRWHRDFAGYLPALRLLRLGGQRTRLVTLVGDSGARREAGDYATTLDAVILESAGLDELAPALERLFPGWHH